MPQRGPVTTSPITRPEVTQIPQNVTVYEGESATFRATVVGTPRKYCCSVHDQRLSLVTAMKFQYTCIFFCLSEPEVKWFKGSNLIKNSKYFRTFVSGNVCTLVITEAFCEDEGEYRLVARSPAGEATCVVFLKVTAGEQRK